MDAQPSEPDGGGGQAEKAASRPLPWRALLLYAMARFPAGAVIGCLLGGVAAGFAAGERPVLIAVTAPWAVLLGLAPAAIRRVIMRARRPRA